MNPVRTGRSRNSWVAPSPGSTMRFAFLLALPLLAGCPDDSKDTDTGPTTTDTDGGDTDVNTDVGGCDSMNAGDDWAWDGACPMMLTPCEIEVTECSLTIAYSSGMTMGMPESGTIDGSTVTFTGGTVDGCTGELIDADNIEGSCADGCTFTLSR